MRKGMWSAAAVIGVLSGAVLFIGHAVQAADTVTMGTDSDPYAFKFFPAEVTVPVGSTVVWENKSDIQHDVKATNGAFKSELLNKGEKFEFKFTAPGEYPYICTPHESAKMEGIIHVTPGGATPTPAPTTPTTAAGGSTATTAAGAATTTTTAKGAAGTGGSTTTTTAAANGATTTTSAPSATPTSAPETAGETTTTTAAAHGGGEEAAADDHASEGASKKDEKKSSPIGIAFAAVSTLLLTAIAGKLLASKS